MKHLRSISELYKSTYLSASDKLKRKSHPTRAKDIKDWAEEVGQSEFSKVDVDRIYPHAFIFTNHKKVRESYLKDYLLGKFYIIDANKSTKFRSEFDAITVTMMNDWGQMATIDIVWMRDGGQFRSMRLECPGDEINSFEFDRRVDARHFLKFIKEWIEDNPELEFEDLEVSINDLYYTE